MAGERHGEGARFGARGARLRLDGTGLIWWEGLDLDLDPGLVGWLSESFLSGLWYCCIVV